MNRVSGAELQAVSRDLERLVPGYNIQKLDPVEALDERVGNCFAKAMLVCGILVVRHGVEPSVAYSSRLHGTERVSSKPVDSKSKRNMAHIGVVAANKRAENEYDVLSIAYGISIGAHDPDNSRFKRDDRAAIQPYNYYGLLVEVVDEDDTLVATEDGVNLGLTVVDWRQGAADYLGAIGREMFSIEELLDQVEDKTQPAEA